MKIRSVRATAFGPFNPRTFNFEDGLTVVHGPNEAGKSSLHAAILAGLCGLKRGKGRRSEEDLAFEAAHRPWGSSAWSVELVLDLASGTSLEVRQNLDNVTSSTVKDLNGGTDLSRTYMTDGTVDAATLVGLDRRTFPATACIRQSDVAGVMGELSSLITKAESAAKDASVSSAIERLEAFKAERVGLDRANATKPLHLARVARDAAVKRCTEASTAHEEYVSRFERLQQLRADEAKALRRVAAAEAGRARNRANEGETLLCEVLKLDAEFQGVAPSTRQQGDELAQRARSALDAWRMRPSPEVLTGKSLSELSEELDSIPDTPQGDTTVAPEVRAAWRALDEANIAFKTRVRDHDGSLPVAEPAQVNASDDELWQIASTLEAAVTPPKPAHAEAATPQASSRGSGLKWLSAIGGVLFGAGILVAASSNRPIGLSLGVLGLLLIAVNLASRRRQGAGSSTRPQIENPDAAQVAARLAGQRCVELGLAPVPTEIRALLASRQRFEEWATAEAMWASRTSDMYANLQTLADDLVRELRARGHTSIEPTVNNALAAYEEYEEACADRNQKNALSLRRNDLRASIENRRAQESRVAAVQSANEQLAENLITVAVECTGNPKDEDPQLAEVVLQTWLDERAANLKAIGEAVSRWQKLQALLAGQSVDDIRGRVAALHREAKERSEGFTDEEVAEYVALDESGLSQLRDRAESATREAEKAEGMLGEFKASIPSVSAAEENLTAAQDELDRVERLARTIDRTVQFLEAAQTRVHSDIAPALNATINRWLPRVTSGRYTEARIYTQTSQLMLLDQSGVDRPVTSYSYGTREQAYLLARVALVDYISKGHEVCPLILDDVTVHADDERTLAILELLQELSEERQIILFTQESAVADWARARLPANNCITLDRVGSAQA